METKYKVIVSVVVLALVFALGRYSLPEKTITVVKTVEVEKKTDTSDTAIHKKATITETTKPDGTKTKTTVITDDRDTKDTTVTTDNKNTDSTTETVRGSSKVNLALMGGVNVLNPAQGLNYGLHISKPILGPVTVGVWALNSGLGGVSVGLEF